MVSLVVFLFGTVLGSFLNVVILRSVNLLSRDEKIHWSAWQGRSQCPRCQATLRWWELIPIVSFVILRGRCFKCRAPISLQYPLVELAMGFLLLGLLPPLLVGSVNNILTAVLITVITALLVVLFVIDWRTMLLPDIFVIALGIAILALLLTTSNLQFTSLILGILVGAGFLLFLWVITRGRGIGLGDVKLMIPLGALFGPVGTTALLFLSFMAGGVVGSVLLLRGAASLKTAIPFGPFLIGSAILIMLLPTLPQALFKFLFGW